MESFYGVMPIKPYTFRGKQDYVYYLYSDNYDLLYIGVTYNLRKRLMTHWRNFNGLFVYYFVTPVKDRETALRLESEQIQKFNPPYNKLKTYDYFNGGI